MPRSRTALSASFEVREGEIFCIMGLSGSGKSTLIRHINRLIEPTDGEIFIDGEDISALAAEPLRQLRSHKIGMVFQNMALLPHRTARENAALALEIRNVDKEERMAAANRALAEVNLNGWEESYPDELSGGMQQRVGLARALAADPRILLMDDFFGVGSVDTAAVARPVFGFIAAYVQDDGIYHTRFGRGDSHWQSCGDNERWRACADRHTGRDSIFSGGRLCGGFCRWHIQTAFDNGGANNGTAGGR